jgi:hypothetical protein
MILSLISTLGLFAQAAALPTTAVPTAAPIRVWRADSTAYVALREPGYVLLLHVDAVGRIRVLFPAAPDDSTAVSADAPLAVALPPVAEGNPATFVAVRTRWPFAWGALRSGSEWDYANAWLLQPTAGDPLAALLDIADRVTDGRPYDYGQVTYSSRGAVVARGPAVQPDVCFTCYRHASAAPAPATVATNSVDCTNASLTNSFCGVNSGSVSIASAPAPAPQVIYQSAPAPAPVYVPYFVPITRGFRHRVELPPVPPPATPASHGVAFPIAPQLIVPSSSQLRTFTGRHR